MNRRALLRPLRNLLIGVGSAYRTLTGNAVGARVVALHDIATPDALTRRIQWLRDRYEILPLSELMADPRRGSLALTFDDGFSSWHETVAPILEELALPATFFVCSDFVGLRGEAAAAFARERLWRRTSGLRPLSRPQLQELAEHDLFEIGAHTRTHADLGSLTDPDALKVEIMEDQERLMEWTGRPIEWFAYPFGRRSNVSRQARAIVSSGSFRGAFSITPGFVTSASDPYFMPRDCLDPSDSDWLWTHWLRGGYDGFFTAKERLINPSSTGADGAAGGVTP